MTTEPKGRSVRNPETHDTRAPVERLFAAYVRGDSRRPFAHVAEEINLTFTGATPLSGEYRSKPEFPTPAE
jgi:ketosteroid isomerase-like protein